MSLANHRNLYWLYSVLVAVYFFLFIINPTIIIVLITNKNIQKFFIKSVRQGGQLLMSMQGSQQIVNLSKKNFEIRNRFANTPNISIIRR